ncbi:MAG: cytochrome C [Legionella sp.]
MKNILSILFLAFTTPLMASDLGKETYEVTCKTCHAPQYAVAIHAPAAFNKKAWANLLKNAEIEAKKHPDQFKTAMDYLLDKASIGKGLMPHGGLCKEADVPHKNCSDKALIEAISYMANSTTEN